MKNGSTPAHRVILGPALESIRDPFRFAAPVLVSLILLAACTAGSATPSSGSASAIDTIVTALRAEGVEVKEVETLQQPFFPVAAHIHTINGEDLQLYEFATAGDAERAAAQVDPRGSSIGTTNMSWLAAPHFYRKDRIIAIHLGSSAAARAALERVLGTPFAGHD